ncbi:virulence-associated E family protein [Corynebacterium cystitidis]|uniref:virulence-associated E family protein n=1 Tax=Corynebacterium cystitidis TaxID=35757 RepID=UPI00211E6340|nr:virulence-associated E family protein [Corynebacterium cystitidis]
MRELTIATAPTRHSTRWTNTHTTKQDLTAAAYDPKTIPHTTTEYAALTKEARNEAKDTGGYVAGHLTNGRRRKGHIKTRSLITLDLDNLPANIDLPTHLADTLDCAWLAHTTLSHTPETPRWRLWIWTTRNTTPDEYQAIARRIAQDINPGHTWFDPSTFEPERFMYWPTTTSDATHYQAHISHGKNDLNPDEVLARYETWQDLTTWPGITPNDAHTITGPGKVDNPTEKPGMLGAFNRAYPIEKAIQEFIPDIYTPGTPKNRWTYNQGTSTNGLIIYNGGRLCYSQHATDPAADGHTHSAFDLIRIHKYGHLDQDAEPNKPANKLPSYTAMMDLANNDPGTRAENAKTTAATISEVFTPITNNTDNDTATEDQETGENTNEPQDPTAWLANLETKKNGEYEKTINNFEIIFTHDPNLNHIAWNYHGSHLEVQDPQALPWTQIKPGWTDNDDAQLKTYLGRVYRGLYAPSTMHDALLSAASKRAFHPVRDYFNHLPPWDGINRLDTLLIDTLGADNTEYTRQVTRKTLVAAHRRTFHPGTKFDHVLTLVGPQGVGKSTIFAKLAGPWFSDSLTITDMKDKTGAEKLLGNLIVELSELAGMRKTEAEPVKGFISRTEDKYRPAYGRTVETYSRQCIIVGSTNADDGFLRDPTGNRRWWAVKVTGQGTTNITTLDQATIDQIWAEARHHDNKGEKLYLEGDVLQTALQVQADSVEADDRTGIVQEYLDKKIPPHWNDLTLGARRIYLDGGPIPEHLNPQPGIWTNPVQRTTVSKIEIWCEAFGREPQDMKRADSYDISAIMQQIDGWEDTGKRERLPLYGRQRVFKRKTATDAGNTSAGQAQWDKPET